MVYSARSDGNLGYVSACPDPIVKSQATTMRYPSVSVLCRLGQLLHMAPVTASRLDSPTLMERITFSGPTLPTHRFFNGSITH